MPEYYGFLYHFTKTTLNNFYGRIIKQQLRADYFQHTGYLFVYCHCHTFVWKKGTCATFGGGYGVYFAD